MRRRPQPNPRRGLLRAGAAIVVLVILLIGALLVISSLTAPKANAPTVPNTPGPVTPGRTPRALPTPIRTPPRATPQPTTKKTHRALGFGLGGIAERRPDARVIMRAARARSADRVFWFSGRGNAYAGYALFLRRPGTASAIDVGTADPYVRPAWSADGRRVLYVRVRQVARYPGASWTLLQFDTATRRSRGLVSITALNLAPLGWSGGHALYITARASDTSVYEVTPRGPRFLSILLTQPITAGTLSPSGRWIAFAAPASCYYCTLDLFDLQTQTVWNGPSGLTNEASLAWTDDSSRLVLQLPHTVAVVNPESHDLTSYARPAGLPTMWPHPLRARVAGASLQLIDRTTGAEFQSSRSAGS